MSKSVKKENNELIIKRRRKRLYKKYFMFFIILISILVLLCLKLPYFNIKNLKVSGNKNIKSDEVIKLSGILKGNNIFYINTHKSKEGIFSNPYIVNVNIEKKLPCTVNINVSERKAIFYGIKNGKFIVFGGDGIILEERSNISGMKLVKLDGFDYGKSSVGSILKSDDKRRIDVIEKIGNILYSNDNNWEINLLDITNIVDIKAYSGNMCLKLGDSEKIDKKINTALNILQSNNLKNAKGYIDVSFDGNPVFLVEK